MSEDKVYNGIVIWFSATRGIGFILWEIDGVEQKDMFVYYSDIVTTGFKTLHKDEKVQFSIGQNNKGQPKAVSVTVVK